jgi:hypothetical protein
MLKGFIDEFAKQISAPPQKSGGALTCKTVHFSFMALGIQGNR